MKRQASIFDGTTSASRWILFFIALGGLVLLASLRREGETIRVTNAPWIVALKVSTCFWFSWGILTPVVFFIDRRLPVRSDALAKRLLFHVPLSVIFILGHTYVYRVIAFVVGLESQPVRLADGLSILLHSFTRPSSVLYWAIVAVGVSFEYQKFLRDQEVRAAEAERLAADAQLRALQAQLHPHFLFNALNCVSDYVDTDPKVARWMLEHLGSMLRILTDNIDMKEIRLSDEFGFLELYLDVQGVRFGDRLTFGITSTPEVLDALVPPLILQPIVENAIVHGPLTRTQAARIEVVAFHSPRGLCLRVTDNGPGFDRTDTLDEWAGIGLLNIRKRLESLYGEGECPITLSNAEGGGAIVEVNIPLRHAQADMDSPRRALASTI